MLFYICYKNSVPSGADFLKSQYKNVVGNNIFNFKFLNLERCVIKVLTRNKLIKLYMAYVKAHTFGHTFHMEYKKISLNHNTERS